MLIDNYSNIARAGWDYDLDLDDAQYWIKHYADK
jgi:hypothetical protein